MTKREDEPEQPVDVGPKLPPDAERMGLRPETAPGLDFANSLRSDRRSHRVIAWVGLLLIAAMIVLLVVQLF
ncbi:hypothetical protein [Flexivirga meconopsidis]|uniref:hypothetical protein n=1 Tax=Flexivirga meconopsidis TaxID=2977121 RepID=UPI0022409EEE|nr:hypothetical protein [Flexivirga meconopsidis]